MSYSRHHHIPQSKDSIPIPLLFQGIGPMDMYQIKWGYMPIPHVHSPNGELPILNRLVEFQDTIPWYRFSLKRIPALGPGGSEEVADNNDPIESVSLGIQNLEKVMALIPKTVQGQRDDALLMALHEEVLSFWYKQMGHVLAMVGGYDIHYKNGDQQGAVYMPIPFADQERAITFVLENAFDPPKWLKAPSYMDRVYHGFDQDRLLYYQLKLLMELLDPERIKRLEFMEEVHGFDGITGQWLKLVRESLFYGIGKDGVRAVRRRRALQIIYLSQVSSALSTKVKSSSIKDLAGFNRYMYSQSTLAILKAETVQIKKRITEELSHKSDSNTRGHWMRCLEYLE